MAGSAGATTLLNVTRTYSATSSPNSELYRQLDLFGDVLERVRADYVEKPDDTKLIEVRDQRHADRARSAFRLLSPKHFRDMQVQTRGEFGGLGIEVTMENGVVKVVSPIDDTPAAKAGLDERRPHHRISTRSRSSASPCSRRSRRCAARSIRRSR